MDRVIVAVGRESLTFEYQNKIGDARTNNPVAVAVARAFKAEGAYCTEKTVSLRFAGEQTYTQVYKLPGIAEAFLNPTPPDVVRIPFSFALSKESRLW